MRIKKIFNNNVVVTDDEKGCEVVVMGKGVAFGKRNGDVVDEGKIGKVYHLGDHEMLEKFKKSVDDGIAEIIGTVEDSTIEKIEYNEDYSIFTVTVS